VGECCHYHDPRTDAVHVEIYSVDDASGVRVVVALALPVGSVPDPAVTPVIAHGPDAIDV
jgi:hypothetical protein